MPGKVSKSKELVPTLASALDQSSPMPNLPQMVERISATVAKSKDIGTALEVVTRLGDFGKISGVGQASALWHTRAKFHQFGEKDNEDANADTEQQQFEQLVFAATGYAPDTVRRYLMAWDFMDEAKQKVDDKTWELFLNRHIQDLIALGQARKEHGPFKAAELKKMSKTPDIAQLRKSIRQATGKEDAHPPITKVSADGTLTVWQDDQSQIIGALVMPEHGDNSIGAKAVARLIKRGKIVEE